jgi:hypothetical protein
MTSLIALAHSQAPVYRGDFYAAIATVIPVLALALGVQGPSLANYLKIIGKVDATPFGYPRSGKMPYLIARFVISYSVSGILTFAAVVVFALTVGGELLALLSLYYGRVVIAPVIPLAAAVTLTIAVAMGPAIALARSYVDVPPAWLRRSRTPDEPPPAPGQE